MPKDREEYAKKFGENLRRLKEKAKLTTDELAKRISAEVSEEISVKTVYAWEIGTRSPHLTMLPGIAVALKLKKTSDILPKDFSK